MKWFVIPAVLTCGLNSMLAAIVLCLAAYHLFTDKSTNAPIEPNQEWIHLVKLLVPFSIFWLLLSVAGMYVSMSRKQIWRATLVIAFYAICFGVSIYFTIAFGNQLDVKEVDSDVLVKNTLKEINAQEKETWIPSWLDNIQKQSKHCCGINTYRDYEEFWPATPSRIPRSCCKEIKSLSAPCPADITLIPYPNTPSDFLKVDGGCMEEIIETTRHHVRESHHNSITMTTFIGCGIVAYIILYAKRYLNASESGNKLKEKVVCGSSNAAAEEEGANNTMNNPLLLETSSGPIIISSSGQMFGTLESMGMVQPISSLEALTSPATQPTQLPPPIFMASSTALNNRGPLLSGLQQQQLQQLLQQQQQQRQLQQQLLFQQLQQQQPQMSQQSNVLQQQQQQQQSFPFQQQNFVQQQQQSSQFQQQNFAQQQQQPAPATQMESSMLGGSTTVSGNNMGRREAYVGVGGNSGKPVSTEQTNQIPSLNARGAVLQTASTDNMGDLVRAEQQDQAPTSPPGSPGGGRRKKVRKDAMASHNKRSS